MVNADIVFRKLHNNEIDDVPIEEGNVIYDLDTKQIFVDDVVDGVLKRVKYGGSEKLIDAIISANTTTKTIYDDTITTDSIIRVYVDEDDSFTYNSISTASGSVTITFNAMTQDVPIKIGIGAVSEFHQLITEGQASDISYNNGQSGMTATDVQEAIDELKSDLGNIELTANNVEYDNVTSGLQATNVQDAVDEITDNLSGFKYYPTGTNLVALVADDSFYKDANDKYVLASSTTGQSMIDNVTYKALPSTEETHGEVGADTVSPFKKDIIPILSNTIRGTSSGNITLNNNKSKYILVFSKYSYSSTMNNASVSAVSNCSLTQLDNYRYKPNNDSGGFQILVFLVNVVDKQTPSIVSFTNMESNGSNRASSIEIIDF